MANPPSDFLSLLAAHQPHSAVQSTDQMTPTELTEYLMKDTIAACPTVYVQPDCLTIEIANNKVLDHIKPELSAIQVQQEVSSSAIQTISYKDELQTSIASVLNAGSDTLIPEERPLVCSLCNFRTKRGDHLRRHVLSVHNIERPFACDECDYRTKRKDHLQLHKLTSHSKEEDKLFACSKCPYRAVLKHQIKIHQTKHSSKLFACDKCDFRNVRRSHLNRHMRTVHSLEKPFACHGCEFRTSYRPTLTRHSKLNCPSLRQTFSCDLCNLKTTTKNNLSQHMLTHKTEVKTPYQDTSEPVRNL